MREIMNYDAEFRSEEATGLSGSIAGHGSCRVERPFNARAIVEHVMKNPHGGREIEVLTAASPSTRLLYSCPSGFKGLDRIHFSTSDPQRHAAEPLSRARKC